MIELHDVRKYYRSGGGKAEILRGVNLRVEPGEYVAIMGKSGSGKSTMLNLLGTLDLLDSGTYELAGKSVHRMSRGRRAKLRNEEIGFVFQHFQLIPNLSVYQNVLLPLTYGRKRLRRKKSRVLALLDEMGISDKKNQKPGRLSGGEKQRVAIARALVNEPRLILADEPTGSLDEETTESILNLFDRVHKNGATIVVITHDIEVAERAESYFTLAERGACMKLFTAFKLACFGLWSNRYRVLSAMMGVVIGMFAVIVLTAIAIGVKDTLMKQMGSLGAEQILVLPGRVLDTANGQKDLLSGLTSVPSTLTYEDAQAIAEVHNVKSVTPQLETINFVEYEDKTVQSALVGTTDQYSRIQHAELSEGRFFTKEEQAAEAKVIVLGNNIT